MGVAAGTPAGEKVFPITCEWVLSAITIATTVATSSNSTEAHRQPRSCLVLLGPIDFPQHVI
jgi:hypothetical protein